MNISNPYAVMLKSLEDACGLTAYAKTLDFISINVATDENYQKITLITIGCVEMMLG